MDKINYKIVIITILIISLTAISCTRNTPTQDSTSRNSISRNLNIETKTKRVQFALLNPIYRFSADIPENWQIEYIPAIESINIYNPSHPGPTLREKSLIFIRHFQADDFLTLPTVDILSRNPINIKDHKAIEYEIEKKMNVADFPEQSTFRNKRHKLIDIRFHNTNPSIFYVIAYNPELPQSEFQRFTQSLIFHNDKSSFVQPISNAEERITKKSFGTYVTPQNSPVQPERFSGWHTGIDYETFAEESEVDVSIFAICGGPVLSRQYTSGYGGVLVQSCLLNNDPITVIYGHLNLASIDKTVGQYLVPGEIIGALGKGYSEQTDNERKHLHLGVHKGSDINIRGYVQNQNQLNSWLDFQTMIGK